MSISFNQLVSKLSSAITSSEATQSAKEINKIFLRLPRDTKEANELPAPALNALLLALTPTQTDDVIHSVSEFFNIALWKRDAQGSNTNLKNLVAGERFWSQAMGVLSGANERAKPGVLLVLDIMAHSEEEGMALMIVERPELVEKVISGGFGKLSRNLHSHFLFPWHNFKTPKHNRHFSTFSLIFPFIPFYLLFLFQY
jgi:hypothetical protein